MRAPYLPKDDVDDTLGQVHEDYRVFKTQGVTVCLLTLPGGFHVSGESSCPDGRPFDEKLGKRLARARAIERLWNFERYRRAFNEGGSANAVG